MKYLFFPFLIVIFFAGCKIYTEKKFHLNKKYSFEKKDDYLKYLIERKIIDENNFLYLDSINYFKFITNEIKNDSSIFYWNSYKNDSLCFNKTKWLTQNANCKGRIEKEIENINTMKIYPDSLLHLGSKVSSFHLLSIKNGKSFIINNPTEEFNVFFNYSFYFGNYYDDLIRNVYKKSQGKVFIISLDPIYQLK